MHILLATALSVLLGAGLPAPSALAGEAPGYGHSKPRLVRPEAGPAFLSHGPERFGGSQLELSGPLPPEEPRPGTPRRRVACASDHYFQAVYAYHRSQRSELKAKQIRRRVGQIRAQLERSNYYLAEQSHLAGGPWIDLKFACERKRRISVKRVMVAKKTFDGMVAELRRKGFRKPNADYIVFADFMHPILACGLAKMTIDSRPLAENEANTDNGHAIVWRPCWEGSPPLHEMAHLMGAVQPDAPNGTGWGGLHCNQGHDLMCYAPDGGERNQRMVRPHPCRWMRFDCRGDDYFNPNPKPGSYLAEHWNLASPLNLSIAFTDRPPNIPRPTTKLQTGRPKGGRGERKRLELGRWYRRKAAGPGRASVYRFGKLPRGARELRVVVRSRKSGPFLDVRLVQRDTRACRRIAAGGRVRCRVRRPGSGGWRLRVRTLAYPKKPFHIKASVRR